MSVSLLIDPFSSFWDSTGSALAGTLEFYEAGTSTPEDTFTDSTGGTANSNPLSLTGGRATVYGTDGQGYKIVLKDSSGATLKTLDNVYTYKTNSQTVANISALVSAATGAFTMVVNGYHTAGDGGGGSFYWDASGDKSTHNGGTIIDPDITFPSDWDNTTELATWFTAGTGTGVWVRMGSYTVKTFGFQSGDKPDVLQYMLNSVTYIDFGNNSFSIDSADLAQLTDDSLVVSNDDTVIRGDSAEITITGSTGCGIFSAYGVSNLEIYGFKITGNNINTSGGNIGSAVYYSTRDASAAISGYRVHDCEFIDFKGDAWVRCQLDSGGDYDIRDVRIFNNKFSGGGARDPVNQAATAIRIVSNDIPSGTGSIEDVYIYGNDIDGSEICQGIMAIHPTPFSVQNITNIHIYGNSIKNIAKNLAAGDNKGYSIGLYGGVKHALVHDNYLFNSWQAGVYSVYCNKVTITNNRVAGQNSTATSGSLARAGIAVTVGSQFIITDNQINDCIRGIEAYTDVNQMNSQLGTTIEDGQSLIADNLITDCSEYGLTTKSKGEPVAVKNNQITCESADEGVYITHGTMSQNAYYHINGNYVIAQRPIRVSSTSGHDTYLKQLFLDSNEAITGSGSTDDGISLGLVDAKNVRLTNNKAIDEGTGTNGFVLTSLEMAYVANNISDGFTNGYRTDNATGTLLGNLAVNVTNIIASQGGVDLGSETPTTGVWEQGAKVENMTPTASGTEGWVCTVGGDFGGSAPTIKTYGSIAS